MSILPAIFAMLVGAAGWYYAFYSVAAAKLADIEPTPTNRLRTRLRRAGGLTMIVLGASFYCIMPAVEKRRGVMAGVAIAMSLGCLMVLLGLALVDLRLTRQLRRDRERLLK